MARDELAGWLDGMTRYAGGGSDRPFWLEAYGGRGYRVERMGRDPVHIDRLAVGVVGSIQPDRLRSLLIRRDDDGLLSRFLPVWPEPAPIRRPDSAPDEAFAESALERLLSMQMVPDEDGNLRPWIMPFTEEARDLLDAFRQAARTWEDDAEGLLLSFIGKLPGLAVRLSLVLAHLDWVARDTEEPIEVGIEPFGRAAHFLEAYALPMARRAYAEVSASKAERAVRRLVDTIREHGWGGLHNPGRSAARPLAHRLCGGVEPGAEDPGGGRRDPRGARQYRTEGRPAGASLRGQPGDPPEGVMPRWLRAARQNLAAATEPTQPTEPRPECGARQVVSVTSVLSEGERRTGLPPGLDAETVAAWEERAAIREYDGGQSREEAERGAATDLGIARKPR